MGLLKKKSVSFPDTRRMRRTLAQSVATRPPKPRACRCRPGPTSLDGNSKPHTVAAAGTTTAEVGGHLFGFFYDIPIYVFLLLLGGFGGYGGYSGGATSGYGGYDDDYLKEDNYHDDSDQDDYDYDDDDTEEEESEEEEEKKK